MSKSNYLENAIINHIFRTATFAKPAGLWVSLHTADPTEAGTGTEVSGGSYARAQLNPADANFDAPVDGATQNSAAITFPAPTANWGVVTHFATWDAASAGNMLHYGALAQSKTINNGDPAPSFPIGALDVSEQ